jgi:TIR domain-containing protein
MGIAGYKYEFDYTTLSELRYSRKDYEILQAAVKLLEDKLRSWNDVAMAHGALEPPYSREVADLRQIVAWGDEKLKNEGGGEILAGGGRISIGNLRYLKAALIHAAWHGEKEVNEKAKDTWPSAVHEALRGRVRRYYLLAEEISQPPAGILDDLRAEYGMTKPESNAGTSWDAFVSHATEDKEAFARPLAEALRARGLSIWYDEFTLTVGDSLRRSIDRGLARSQFGVVVLSPNFFSKEWPQKELDGLVAREVDGKKVILPVWHNIDVEGIRRFSPMLADRVAVSSRNGLQAVVNALIAGMRP